MDPRFYAIKYFEVSIMSYSYPTRPDINIIIYTRTPNANGLLKIRVRVFEY